MDALILSSNQELDQFYAKLKLMHCPHCKRVGTLIKHGFLRGYDTDHQLHKTIRAARVYCSNRNRSLGCGRTFSLWMADKVKRLFLSANTLWQFLTQAAANNNKMAAFRSLQSGLSDSAPYRIWKRFSLAQSSIRTALISICEPPQVESKHPAQLTIAHLQKAFVKHALSPIAALAVNFQKFFF